LFLIKTFEVRYIWFIYCLLFL